MSDQLENVDLSGHSLNVCHIDDAVLLQNLDGYLLACEVLLGQLDLPEGSLTESFT